MPSPPLHWTAATEAEVGTVVTSGIRTYVESFRWGCCFCCCDCCCGGNSDDSHRCYCCHVGTRMSWIASDLHPVNDPRPVHTIFHVCSCDADCPIVLVVDPTVAATVPWRSRGDPLSQPNDEMLALLSFPGSLMPRRRNPWWCIE